MPKVCTTPAPRQERPLSHAGMPMGRETRVCEGPRGGGGGGRAPENRGWGWTGGSRGRGFDAENQFEAVPLREQMTPSNAYLEMISASRGISLTHMRSVTHPPPASAGATVREAAKALHEAPTAMHFCRCRPYCAPGSWAGPGRRGRPSPGGEEAPVSHHRLGLFPADERATPSPPPPPPPPPPDDRRPGPKRKRTPDDAIRGRVQGIREHQVMGLYNRHLEGPARHEGPFRACLTTEVGTPRGAVSGHCGASVGAMQANGGMGTEMAARRDACARCRGRAGASRLHGRAAQHARQSEPPDPIEYRRVRPGRSHRQLGLGPAGLTCSPLRSIAAADSLTANWLRAVARAVASLAEDSFRIRSFGRHEMRISCKGTERDALVRPTEKMEGRPNRTRVPVGGSARCTA